MSWPEEKQPGAKSVSPRILLHFGLASYLVFLLSVDLCFFFVTANSLSSSARISLLPCGLGHTAKSLRLLVFILCL